MTPATKDEIRDAFRRGIAVAIAAAPFAVLFGAVAVDNGLTIAETALMSATLYAGASQLVGVELFNHNVAPWLVVLSIFAVNFRHVLYSAAIAAHIRHLTFWQKATSLFLLTDPQFAETERRADAGIRVSYVWSMVLGLSVYVPWLCLTIVGGFLGNLIGDPKAIGIDVLLPIYFMGLVLGFRSRANWLPVVIASAAGSILAMHFVGSPWHVSLGALAGVVVAALMPLDGKESEAAIGTTAEGEA
ncbi:AzlC family ABC transporter permease [Shinella kummerowiae]|jgi:predicted branched-subunit amino acid permease|uniref:AzlC family ABC transporter permease n=1 Tax=Shinella kummerowiae TaxID=417745 RepID=UPI0021B5A230|nr:AzlC family ABC transporter permease [Shinella kummerowiae]MCT7663727.1 AzlC family ABC transporter permease [Shinella kummerowiae]